MKKRVITALLIGLVVLPLILIGGIPFLIGITTLLSLAMYEITNANKSSILTKVVTIGFIVASSIYSYFNIANNFINFNLLFVFLPILTLFTIALFDKKQTLLDACYNSVFTVLLSIFATSLLELRYTFNNANLIAYMILATTSVDSFALFVGCKYGKHRLNERISPKKSIEGSIGGIIGGTIVTTLFATFFPILTSGDTNVLNLSFTTNIIWMNVLYSFLITLVLSVVGQIGDLMFSMIKRNYQIKDFSNILPGHGGFADRIDSLCINSITLSVILSLIAIL